MNQEEINNLLALTAMTAIAPEEIQSVEKMAVSSPEIEKELRSLRETASTLAYVEPALSVPTSLKQRLFNRFVSDSFRQVSEKNVNQLFCFISSLLLDKLLINCIGFR